MKHSNVVMFGFALVLCLFVQTSYTQQYYDQYPQSVRNYMATRQMRYHHYMWHQVRANWNKFSSSTQDGFRNIGWDCPNPLTDSSGQTITNSYSGEDFLYMHRHMIQEARQSALRNGESTTFLYSWSTVPSPGDSRYPVPPAFQYGSISNYYAEYKTQDRYNSMRRSEQQFKDYNRLRRMSLNDLGVQIENSIHSALHYRWTSESSVGYRTGGTITRQDGVLDMDHRWDDPSYDWMGDSYASHVNPLFWKLHGWIDDRVEDWRRANGLNSITWRGTWIGGPVENLGSVLNKMKAGMHDMNGEGDPDAVGDVLQKAFELFMKSGVPEVSIGDVPPLPSPKRRVLKTCKKKRRNRH